MTFLIIVIVVLIVAIKWLNYKSRLDQENNLKSTVYNTTIEYDRSPYDSASGYQNFEIKGIFYRNLGKEIIGDFSGYAIAEKNNYYDEYAVAIYNNEGIQLGYAPGGYYSLHEYINKQGGKVAAYGTIWNSNGRTYGRVNIQFDPNHFHNDIPEEERIYKRPNLKKYQLKLSSNYPQGKFYGYADLGNNNDFIIYNHDHNIIGKVADQEYLYNTVKQFDGGKVEVWGYITSDGTYSYVYIPGRCSEKKIQTEKEKFIAEKIPTY